LRLEKKRTPNAHPPERCCCCEQSHDIGDDGKEQQQQQQEKKKRKNGKNATVWYLFFYWQVTIVPFTIASSSLQNHQQTKDIRTTRRLFHNPPPLSMSQQHVPLITSFFEKQNEGTADTGAVQGKRERERENPPSWFVEFHFRAHSSSSTSNVFLANEIDCLGPRSSTKIPHIRAVIQILRNEIWSW
jgi:hypothetical protein